MKPDIIIPTNRTEPYASPILCDVQGNSFGCRVLATCRDGSAALNRNVGLEWAESDYIIMLDDDTSGFYIDWWKDLIQPLVAHEDVCMVSARLMHPEIPGKHGKMMFQGNIAAHISEVPQVPTACCSFRRDSLRFDESFIGSGFEDTFFCECKKALCPGSRAVITNSCQIRHRNEEKGQADNWAVNKGTYDDLMERLKAGEYPL